jgi:hypothetical protein
MMRMKRWEFKTFLRLKPASGSRDAARNRSQAAALQPWRTLPACGFSEHLCSELFTENLKARLQAVIQSSCFTQTA